MSKDKIEILKSGYESFSNTNSELQVTQQYLNGKAIDLIKIVLLVATLMASIVTFSDFYQSVFYFIGGSAILILSSVFCILTFSHNMTYHVGVSEEAKDMMLDETNVEKHYRNLLIAYSNCVRQFDEKYSKEKDYFQSGLESAVIAILLYLIGALKFIAIGTMYPNYPIWYDVVVVGGFSGLLAVRLFRRFQE
ncbi:hypothetical protein ACFQGT_09820 [Natrialbaceae archaeon GCM10025810]|uniref:hypothetical protein n=1 Tax=Halovalidus salilacus TaxID=3075124 RepID=UPI00360E3F3A